MRSRRSPFAPLLPVLAALSAASLTASPFVRTYGGPGDETAAYLRPSQDGHLVLAGRTTSFGAGESDLWVLGLDEAGVVRWERTYGTAGEESLGTLLTECTGGGYCLSGNTSRPGSDEEEFFVLRVADTGDVAWQRVLTPAGPAQTWPLRAVPTMDGGFFVGGTFARPGAADDELVVARLDAAGDMEWDLTLGGSGNDVLLWLAPSPDDGVALVAATGSFDAVDFNVLAVGLRPWGSVAWQAVLDAGHSEVPQVVAGLRDGGFVIGGYGGDIGANNFAFTWVIRLDAGGAVVWSKRFDGPERMAGLGVVETADGDILVAGSEVDPDLESSDLWVARLDEFGDIAWQRTFGGALSEWGAPTVELAGGELAIAATTESFGAGGQELWLLRLAADGTLGVPCAVEAEGTWTAVDMPLTVSDPGVTPGTGVLASRPGDFEQGTSEAAVTEQCVEVPGVPRLPGFGFDVPFEPRPHAPRPRVRRER